MRFAPSSSVSTPTHESDKDRRSSGDVGGVRYILQVPSLASSTGGGPSSLELSRNGGGDDLKDPNSRRPGSSYPNQVTPGWPNRPHVSLGYQPHSYGDPHPNAAAANHNHPAPGSGGGQWKYYPEAASQWVGSASSNHAIETSSPNSLTSQRSVPPYSPIRVRSGRGACRLPLSRSRTVPDVDPAAASRSSFPVSNRGKGGKAAIRRVSHPCPSEAYLSGSGMGPDGFAVGDGADSAAVLSPSSVAEDGTDPIEDSKPRMSILKRKLPLMRKSTPSPGPFSAAGEGGDGQVGGMVRVATPPNDRPADQQFADKGLAVAPLGDKSEEEKKEDEEGDGARSRGGLEPPSTAFLRQGGSTSPVATQVTPV
jgi:hypothetical protein